MRAFLVDMNGARAGQIAARLSPRTFPPNVGDEVIARDVTGEMYPAVVEAVGASHLRLRLVAI